MKSNYRSRARLALAGRRRSRRSPSPRALRRRDPRHADEEAAFVLVGERRARLPVQGDAERPECLCVVLPGPRRDAFRRQTAPWDPQGREPVESTSDRSSVSGVVKSSQSAWRETTCRGPLSRATHRHSGLFAGVTSIQRVNTSGGAAPSHGMRRRNAGRRRAATSPPTTTSTSAAAPVESTDHAACAQRGDALRVVTQCRRALVGVLATGAADSSASPRASPTASAPFPAAAVLARPACGARSCRAPGSAGRAAMSAIE
jgi:hypothetical protein